MKKIDTSNITDTQQLNLLGRTLDFIQENVQEQATALAYSAMNSAVDSAPIALYGCIGTYSTVGFANDTYTITKGAILYNGEIYQVPAMVATRANIGETIVFRIDTATYQAGEPTPYTDGTPRNTNQIRTIKIYNGATGSGIVDAVNLKYYNKSLVINHSGSWVANEMFSAATFTNCTLDYYIINSFKKGDVVTVNGQIKIAVTATIPIIKFTLTDKYKYKDDSPQFFNCNCTKLADSYRILCSNADGGVYNDNILKFNDIGSAFSGDNYIIAFSFSYQANEIG